MTSKLKCPFCQTELEDAGIHSAELYFCCTNCYMKQKEKDDNYTASPRIWQALIQSQQQLKILEPIVASLQGRADINAEVARDSNELVVQWYEKYEQSQKDLEIARKALEDITIVRCGLEDFEPKAVTMTRIAEKALKQIEHKEDK